MSIAKSAMIQQTNASLPSKPNKDNQQKRGFFDFCMQPLYDTQREIQILPSQVNKAALSVYKSKHSMDDQAIDIVGLRQNHPRRPLQLQVTQHYHSYKRPQEAPNIVPNKFQCRRYMQTAYEYPDISEETIKKECYQIFLAKKRQDPTRWHKNFQELFSQVDRRSDDFQRQFARLIEEDNSRLY